MRYSQLKRSACRKAKRKPPAIASLALFAVTFWVAPVLAQDDDRLYCPGGVCRAIGPEPESEPDRYEEVHVLKNELIARPNGKKNPNHFPLEKLKEAVNRVAHNGTLYLHEGVYDFDYIEINRRETIKIAAYTNEFGAEEVVLQPTGACLIVNPRFVEDGDAPHVTIQGVKIRPKTLEHDACIDARASHIHLFGVEIDLSSVNDKTAVNMRSGALQVAGATIVGSGGAAFKNTGIRAHAGASVNTGVPTPICTSAVKDENKRRSDNASKYNTDPTPLSAGEIRGVCGVRFFGLKHGVDLEGLTKLSDVFFKNNQIGAYISSDVEISGGRFELAPNQTGVFVNYGQTALSGANFVGGADRGGAGVVVGGGNPRITTVRNSRFGRLDIGVLAEANAVISQNTFGENIMGPPENMRNSTAILLGDDGEFVVQDNVYFYNDVSIELADGFWGEKFHFGRNKGEVEKGGRRRPARNMPKTGKSIALWDCYVDDDTPIGKMLRKDRRIREQCAKQLPEADDSHNY